MNSKKKTSYIMVRQEQWKKKTYHKCILSLKSNKQSTISTSRCPRKSSPTTSCARALFIQLSSSIRTRSSTLCLSTSPREQLQKMLQRKPDITSLPTCTTTVSEAKTSARQSSSTLVFLLEIQLIATG